MTANRVNTIRDRIHATALGKLKKSPSVSYVLKCFFVLWEMCYVKSYSSLDSSNALDPGSGIKLMRAEFEERMKQFGVQK